MANNTYTLTLKPSLILETVKTETRMKAQFDLAANNQANARIAANEEAGDENAHERKLSRSLYGGIDRIKAEVVGLIGDTDSAISSTYSNDVLTFTLTLDSRFNDSYISALAGLFSKYIEDFMLQQWWAPINPDLYKVYTLLMADDANALSRCFVKKAPTVSNTTYADVTGQKTVTTPTTQSTE